MYDLYVNGELVEGDEKKKIQEQYGLPDDSKKEEDKKGTSNDKVDVLDYIYSQIEPFIPTSNEVRSNPRPANEVRIIRETLSKFIMISSDNPNELIFIYPSENNQELIVRRISKAALYAYLAIGNKEQLLIQAGNKTADFGSYIAKVATSKLILRSADLARIANSQALGKVSCLLGGGIKVVGKALNVYGFMSLILTNSAPEPVGEEAIQQSTIREYERFLKK